MSNQTSNGVPTPEIQLEHLRNDLVGNKAFGRLRGAMAETRLAYAVRLASLPPPRATEEWKADNEATVAMAGLLRELHDNGWTVAEEELVRALREPRYRLTGETVPSDQTSPYTVIVIAPEETFAFLGWLRAIVPQRFRQATEELWNRENGVPNNELNPALRRIVERTKKPEWRGPDTWRDGPSFNIECWNALLSAFAQRLDIPNACTGSMATNLVPLESDLSIMYLADKWNPDFSPWTQARITSALHRIPIASCAFGVPRRQSEALAAFPPSVQEQFVASWQFDLPTEHRFSSPKKRFKIGFHPEVEYERWRRERPQFASNGVSHGWGAIILPRTEPHAHTWYTTDSPHLMLRAF